MSPKTRRAQLLADPQPQGKQDHDVLVFPRTGVIPEWEYFRLPVNKTHPLVKGRSAHPGKAGEFVAPPEKWDPSDNGERKVLSVARPSDANEVDLDRGPAFALLPVKPDPGSASFPTCFIVNVNHLDTPNLWTVEEWNDGPTGPDFPTPLHKNEFEVLLAGPHGKVFRLKLTNLSAWRNGVLKLPENLGEVECVHLGHQTEIWTQLRNGCIAGRVLYHETVPRNGSSSSRVVPLVNITALTPGLARPAVGSTRGES